MNSIKNLTSSAIAALALTAVPALAGHHEQHAGAKHDTGHHHGMMQQDIVSVAAKDDSFSTLVAALKAAGLAGTLQGQGPFTVFAPTNAAFEKLPEGTVENLLKPGNREQLVAILSYHVVPGAVYAEDVVELDAATTVQGGDVSIEATPNGVMVNDATVILADVVASNGVIHVIDTVILPEQS